MNISVIGAGYVGLVTAAVFADLGNAVICLDTDEKKVEQLLQGIMPIYEPGLDEMVKRNMEARRIVFTTEYAATIQQSDILFIAVGTPPKSDGETDLSQVAQAARQIGRCMNGYKIVVNKSTVPVGTGDFVQNIIKQENQGAHDFDIVSNPEFLREGNAIYDTLYPDRIVIGANKNEVAMKLLELYASLEKPMIITDVRSAEVIKYASNAFLATKISFMNMVADLCEKCGADINHIKRGMGLDHRIGTQFINAGLGYGGSCFPKDTLSLIHTAGKYDVDFGLLKEVVTINDARSAHFVSLLQQRFGALAGKRFAVFGLSFKPDTDDMREAKSIEIVRLLHSAKAEVRAYDPIAMDNARKLMPEVRYCRDPYHTVEDCHAILLVTEWREFKFLDLRRLKGLMRSAIIFDGRHLYNKQLKEEFGFEYYALGIPNSFSQQA